MKRLVLFDIDETIIFTDGVGRRAMESAMSEVFGKTIDSNGHNFSGKTDPQICMEILTTKGFSRSEIEARLPETFQVYLQSLAVEIERAERLGLHPGVMDLITQLHQEDWAYLGLLTGNIEGGARLKLDRFDLNKFFQFGAFGCDSANRLDLPAIAHERGQKVFGQEFSRPDLVIIGDAENDVLCANGYGIKSIIVTTGKTPREALASHSPTYLYETLQDTKQVLEAILS